MDDQRKMRHIHGVVQHPMSPKNTIPLLLTLLGLTGLSHAATIVDDFESGLGGWIQINDGNGTIGTSTGSNHPNSTGSSTSASINYGTDQVTPGAYLVNQGTAFDVTQAFSGTFDFYVNEEGNYSAGNFIIGDVQSGITGLAGEFINFQLDEKQFGSRADLHDGDGSLINGNSAANNNWEIFTNEWNQASFSWTPTSGTSGTMEFSWVRFNGTTEPGWSGSEAFTYTFNSNEIYFGFGSGDSETRFDNINITGTAIPEPSVALLSGIGFLMLLRRKKR